MDGYLHTHLGSRHITSKRITTKLGALRRLAARYTTISQNPQSTAIFRKLEPPRQIKRVLAWTRSSNSHSPAPRLIGCWQPGTGQAALLDWWMGVHCTLTWEPHATAEFLVLLLCPVTKDGQAFLSCFVLFFFFLLLPFSLPSPTASFFQPRCAALLACNTCHFFLLVFLLFRKRKEKEKLQQKRKKEERKKHTRNALNQHQIHTYYYYYNHAC